MYTISTCVSWAARPDGTRLQAAGLRGARLRGARRAFLGLCLVLMGTSNAHAVLVFVKGQKEPTRGYLVRENAAVVVIDEVLDDGTLTRREISRATIEEVLNLVSAERLQTLRPSAPHEYRDYAEELAAKKRDPDAQQTAVRLFLIAAHLDPAGLGPSSLRGMTALARNGAEEKRFRAMAYLLDPAHDPNILTSVSEGPVAELVPESTEILTAIRLLRKGNKAGALKMAGQPAIKQSFRRIQSILSHSEFVLACAPSREGGKIAAPLLRKLLLAELALTDEGAPQPAAGEPVATKSVWSDALGDNRTHPVPTLTLSTLTELDPTRCVYQDGVWIAPDSGSN